MFRLIVDTSTRSRAERALIETSPAAWMVRSVSNCARVRPPQQISVACSRATCRDTDESACANRSGGFTGPSPPAR